MAKSNAGRNVIIVLVVLLVLGGLAIGSFFAFGPQAVVQQTRTEYRCPEGFFCEAQPIYTCNIQVSEPEVVFRRSNLDGLPSKIAVDTNVDGSLEPYSKASGFVPGCNQFNNQDDRIVRLPDMDADNFVYSQNRDILICETSTNKGWLYDFGGDISTAKTPQQGESCDDFQSHIRCIGETDFFVCDPIEVRVDGILKQTLVWSESKPTPPGGFKGQKQFMTGNQLLTYAGPIDVFDLVAAPVTECILSNGEIVEIGDPAVCTTDKISEVCTVIQGELNPEPIIDEAFGREICINGVIQCRTGDCLFPSQGIGEILDTSDGYFKCKQDEQNCFFTDYDDVFFCEEPGELFDETDLMCQANYRVELTLDKATLGTEEDISGKIELLEINPTQRDQIPARITVEDETGSTSRLPSANILTDSRGRRTFNLGTIDRIGDFVLKVKVTHPELGIIEVIDSFTITAQLQLELRPAEGTGFTQFENQPIRVRAEVTSGGQPESVRLFIVNAEFNGRAVPYDITPLPGKGRVEISANVDGEGNMKFFVIAEDESGFRTEEQPPITITVEKAGIRIFPDIKSANNQPIGTYTTTFETQRVNGDSLNTDGKNIIIVTAPDTTCDASQPNELSPVSGRQCDATISVLGTNGQYSFSYNFDKSGQYFVDISSFAEGFELSQSTRTSINIIQKDIEDDTRPIFIAVIVGILAIIGVIVFFVIRSRRRRN